MPAFTLLIIIVAIFLWLSCSFLYKPIGRVVRDIIEDTQEAIKDEEDQDYGAKGENKDEKNW